MTEMVKKQKQCLLKGRLQVLKIAIVSFSPQQYSVSTTHYKYTFHVLWVKYAYLEVNPIEINATYSLILCIFSQKQVRFNTVDFFPHVRVAMTKTFCFQKSDGLSFITACVNDFPHGFKDLKFIFLALQMSEYSLFCSFFIFICLFVMALVLGFYSWFCRFNWIV